MVEYMASLASLCHVYQLCHAVYQLAGVCMAVWSRHGPGTDWSAEMGTGALYPGHCFHHPSAVTELRPVQVSSPHCADHVTLTPGGWGWKGNM